MQHGLSLCVSVGQEREPCNKWLNQSRCCLGHGLMGWKKPCVMAKMVSFGLVGSHLDYVNSVLFETTQKNISKLQKAQNLLARVVIHSPQSCSSRYACHSTRSLRLSNTNLLSALLMCTLFGGCSFSVEAPKFGTLSLYLSVPVPVLIPSVVTSRPSIASRPTNPLNTLLFLCLRFGFC